MAPYLALFLIRFGAVSADPNDNPKPPPESPSTLIRGRAGGPRGRAMNS